jgi:hypothetical protein
MAYYLSNLFLDEISDAYKQAADMALALGFTDGRQYILAERDALPGYSMRELSADDLLHLAATIGFCADMAIDTGHTAESEIWLEQALTLLALAEDF